MNAVERVVHYNDLQQEAAYEAPEAKPPSSWPAQGQIDFDKVVMGESSNTWSPARLAAKTDSSHSHSLPARPPTSPQGLQSQRPRRRKDWHRRKDRVSLRRPSPISGDRPRLLTRMRPFPCRAGKSTIMSALFRLVECVFPLESGLPMMPKDR